MRSTASEELPIAKLSCVCRLKQRECSEPNLPLPARARQLQDHINRPSSPHRGHRVRHRYPPALPVTRCHCHRTQRIRSRGTAELSSLLLVAPVSFGLWHVGCVKRKTIVDRGRCATTMGVHFRYRIPLRRAHRLTCADVSPLKNLLFCRRFVCYFLWGSNFVL